MLVRAGYEAVLAATGDDALRMMRDRAPDAVVVDVMIPHPDGIEVCRKFRRDGWRGPMIAISARSSADHRRRTLDAGADTFLGKPFRLVDLIDTLDQLDHGER
jgi:DNA-binding response OmpR family regulator